MSVQLRGTGAILRRGQVEREVGLKRSTIYQRMQAGTFPRPIRLGERAVGWRASDIERFLEDPAGYPKVYIDSMLLNWGDRLFQEPFGHARAQRLSQASLRDEAARMREQLVRTLRRTPEVMIKITNKASGAQGIGAVRRHLRYISRNGQVELEDQNGDRVSGAEAVRDLVQTWQLGGWGIPETSVRREVFNILLSMPPGTNRQAVRDAVRDFAAIEFGDGRAYVFAAHDDEAHPHVHLSVQVRGPDGRRLNPRKQDLRRWRERFAEQLRANGVDANATPRRVRGETRRYPVQGVRHMVERGETPKYWRAVANEKQRQTGWQAHDMAFAAWREVARTVAASPAGADRAMAVGIVEFVRAMPVQRDAVVPDIQRDSVPKRENRTAPERDSQPDDPGPDIER